MADVEAVAEVSAALSQKSLDALSLTISKALDKGLKNFGKKIADALGKAGLDKIQKDLAASAKKWADELDRVGTRGTRSLRGLTTGLGASNKETLKLIQSMEKLAQSQEVIGRAVTKAASDFRAQTSLINQATKERTRLTDRAGQEQIEIARDAAKREVVITQGAEQQKVVAARFAGQQRVQLTRAVIENIARLERGLAATLAGIARTAVGATGKVFGSLTSMFGRGGASAMSSSTSSFTSSIKRMNSEMNRDLTSSLTRRERSLQSSFSRQEQILSRSALRQSQTLEKLRKQTSTGVLGAATGRGIGPGLGTLGAGVGVGALLTAGFTRFSELERLNKQFLALTGNAEKAAVLMAEVKQFAKLTPFDLVGVAGLAKGFLAIGTAAEQVMPQVKAIADAVALTGGGVEQLDRIQRAIGQVVSTGKLQGDELNQLAENLPGLNIRKLLAKQLTGGDVAKLVEMQAAGEISGEAFVDGLITGLQQDQRLVGASEDLAKTLGGIAANTKESFADLGAAIIGLFAPQLKAAFKGAQVSMQAMADFIKGEGLSTGLDTLRTALGGVAAGLAAVAAAKGAIEVFGLLAKTLALVASPLGLIAVAAGVLGGALALVWQKSVPFRMALQELRDRFGELAGRIGEFVSGKLAAFGEFITRTVIPALIRLADWVGAHLLGAFEAMIAFLDGSVFPTISRWAQIVVRDLLGAYRATVNFITSKVIPAIKSFVEVLRAEVFPVVADVARTIGHGFMEALGAVLRFGQRVRPYIQPAIDGFKELWHSIQNALGGDFSGLGSGAMGALGGIGSSIVNLWDLAFEALRPLAQKALDLIKSVFTIDNLITAGKAVLDFVEWIGDTIGSIVSHPAFIAAVAGIVAAAALVGLRFLEGFVRGVITNIPTLLGYVKDAFLDNWLIVLGVVAGGVALAAVVRGFRSMGAQAGGGFLSGLRTTMAGSIGLTQGLLGGGGKSLLVGAALKNVKDVTKEAAVLQSRLLTFGVQKLYDPNVSGLKSMKADLTRVNKLLPESVRMGLLMRESFQAFGKVIATGLRVEGFVGAMKNFWATLRQQATAGGPTVGMALAKGIGSGLAIGFAGFTAGKMMGEAGQSPLMSILTGAFTGFALSGGNPIAAAVGALAAGIGAAIGKSGKEAKEAAGRIKDYANAIGEDLKSAVDSTSPALAGFNDLLMEGDADAFLTRLRSALEGVTPALNDLGLSTLAVAQAFDSGPAAVEAMLDKLRATSRTALSRDDFSEFAAAESAIKAIKRAWDETAAALDLYNQKQRDLMADVFNGPSAFSSKQTFDRFGGFSPSLSNEDKRLAAASTPTGTSYGTAISDAREFYEELRRLADREAADDRQSRKIRNLADDSRAWQRELARVDAQYDHIGDKPKPPTLDQLADDAADLLVELTKVNTAIDTMLRDQPTTSLGSVMRDFRLGLVGGAGALNLDGFLDDLELSAFKDDLVSKLSPIFAQAVTEGWSITPEAFDPLADQMIESLMRGVEDPDGKIRAQLATLMEELRTDIKNNPLTFDPTIVGFDEMGVAYRTSWGKVPKVNVGPADVNIDTTGINKKMDTGGVGAGVAMFTGMVRGINFGKGPAIAAAAAAADAVVAKVRATLIISSPSKVFERIGEQIMEGLEIGIEDSTATVGDKMADAIRSAVDAAVEAAKGGTAALRTAGSSLFSALTGSGGALTGGSMIGQIGGWTSAIQSFMESATSTASKVFAVALKKFEGEVLTAGELNIFGESPFSLDLRDVLGAENVNALKGVLDTIAGFGSEMLELGVPASDVVARLKDLRDQLLWTSGALGFNVDEVRNLIDSLGLSDIALADFVVGIDSVTAAASEAAKAAAAAAAIASHFPSSMTPSEAQQLLDLRLEAVTLSPADLAVFMRVKGLGPDFLASVLALQKDIADNTHDENLALGRIYGLWGSSLASFVKDLEDWLKGLSTAIPESPWGNWPESPGWVPDWAETGPPPGWTPDWYETGPPPAPPPAVDPNAPTGTPVTHLPRPPINVTINAPYGDPYAIGLSAANAVAMAAMLPGN